MENPTEAIKELCRQIALLTVALLIFVAAAQLWR